MIRSTTVLLLLCFLCGVATATANKRECLELERAKALKQHLETSHVLVWVGDDQEAYEEICSRYANTPSERVKDLVIAKLSGSSTNSLKNKLVQQSKLPKTSPWNVLERMKRLIVPPPVVDNVHVDDDNDDSHSVEYILFQQGDLELQGLQFVATPLSSSSPPPPPSTSSISDDEESENDDTHIAVADDVTTFVAKQLRRKKIGNFVYSLGTFDLIAAMVMNNTDGLQATNQAKVWAYLAKAIALTQTYLNLDLFGRASSAVLHHNAELANIYVKIMFQVLGKGPFYPSQQITRLETMLEQDSSQISDLKKEQLQQRIHTLKKFTDPAEYTQEQTRNFMIQTALNLGVWIFLVVLIAYVFLATEEEEEEEEESDNANGDGDDAADENDSEEEDKKEK